MRTAKFNLDKEIFFDLLGLPYFQGDIERAEKNKDGGLTVYITGYDNRIPDRINFPNCAVVCKTVQAHFEELNNNTASE